MLFVQIVYLAPEVILLMHVLVPAAVQSFNLAGFQKIGPWQYWDDGSLCVMAMVSPVPLLLPPWMFLANWA